MTDTATATPAAVRFSYDHRTAWRHAYNVYRGSDLIGFVYRGSDDLWHGTAADGVSVTSGTRRDVGRWLNEHFR